MAKRSHIPGITTRRMGRIRPSPRLREIGKRDPAVQSLLSAAHASPFGGRGPDRLDFVRAGNYVAEPRGQLASAQRRVWVCEDSGGDWRCSAVFALVRPLRFFQLGGEVGPDIPAPAGAGVCGAGAVGG